MVATPNKMQLRQGHVTTAAEELTSRDVHANKELQSANSMEFTPSATVRSLEGFSSKSFMLFMAEMGVGLLAMPLGWIAKPFGKQQAVHNAMNAPLQALRHTTMSEIHKVPENIVKAYKGTLEVATAEKAAATAAAASKEGKGFINGLRALPGNTVQWVSSIPGKVTSSVKGIQHVPVLKAFKTEGASAALSSVVKGAGRMSVFNGIIVAGIAAGTAGLLLRTKEENNDTAKALKEMAGDILGVPAAQVTNAMMNDPKAPALLKAANAQFAKQKSTKVLSNSLQLGSDGIFLATLSSPMAMATMAAQMGMSVVAGSITTENPYLNAYGMLKASERGQGVLEQGQKVALVKMMVAASPLIEKEGGLRNAMVAPIAEQMVKENLSVKAMLKEIGDDRAIANRAVAAKLALDEAKTKMPTQSEIQVKSQEAVPQVKAAPMIEGGAKVGAVAHQGRVQQAEKAQTL